VERKEGAFASEVVEVGHRLAHPALLPSCLLFAPGHMVSVPALSFIRCWDKRGPEILLRPTSASGAVARCPPRRLLSAASVQVTRKVRQPGKRLGV
jgi:hypothetical protein